jgi:N6-L-threonylcarbamoyladenine synthase
VQSNVVANQLYKLWRRSSPTSRAHQQNIVPVIDAALNKAGIKKNSVAFTGPGFNGLPSCW